LIMVYHGSLSFYINYKGDAVAVNIQRYPTKVLAHIKFTGSRMEPQMVKAGKIEMVWAGKGMLLRGDREVYITTERGPVRKGADYLVVLHPRKDKVKIFFNDQRTLIVRGEAFDFTHCRIVTKLHSMNIEEEFLRLMIDGKKKVEGRLYDEKRRQIRAGDYLRFIAQSGLEAYFLVTDVKVYPGFMEMLESEGLHNVLPKARSLANGIRVYRRFYREREELEYGVCAIHIVPL